MHSVFFSKLGTDIAEIGPELIQFHKNTIEDFAWLFKQRTILGIMKIRQHYILMIAGALALLVWVVDSLIQFFGFTSGMTLSEAVFPIGDPRIFFTRIFAVSIVLLGGKLFVRLVAQFDITKKQEEHLRATLAFIGDAVIETDAGGSIVWMNRVAESLTGWVSQDASGRPLTDIFHIENPITGKKMVNPVARVLQEGKAVGMKGLTVLIAKDGARYRIADSAAPVFNDDRLIAGVILVFRDVTEDHRIREKLKQNEERLKLALYGASNGVWDWRLDENEVFFDEQYYAMAGYKPNAFPGKFEEWEKRVHPDDYESVKKAMENYLSGAAKSYDEEFRFLNNAGEYMWIRARGKTVLSDDSGRPIRFIGTHSDISKQKQVEKAYDDVYRILNNSHLVVFNWRNEAHWPVAFVTDNVEKVLGYHPNDLLSGKIRYEQMVHPDDLERVQQEVVDFSSEEGRDSFEHQPYRVFAKNGDVRWVEDQTYIGRDSAGKITHYYGIITDITERREREKRLLMTQFSFEKAEVGIYWIDKDGVVIEVNDKAAEVLGYTREEILYTKIYDRDRDPKWTEEIWRPLWQHLLDNGRDTIHTSHRAKDGRLVPVEIFSNLLEFDGQPYSIAFSIDITERKQAEDALRQSLSKLQTIYNSLPIVIWSLDTEGIFTLSEGKGLADLGLNPGEVVGSSVFEFYKDEPILLDATKKALNGESSEQETDVGGIILSSYLTPMFDENMTVCGVNGLAVDVTENRKAEIELRQLRNYLSNIVNSMPSALVGVSNDGRVTQWNETVAKSTGIDAEVAQGRILSDILPQMASEMEKISRSIRSRQTIQEQKRTNTITKSAVFEDMTIYPLITDGVEGAVIRIDDVTEKVRMEEMMIQSEKMLSVGGLAAGMAHEINNPLAGIMQTAGVLSNRLSADSNIPANLKAAEEAGTTIGAIQHYMKARGIPRMIETINNSGKRVADIVKNMLSFAQKSGSTISSHALDELLEKTIKLAGTDYDMKKHNDFRKIEIVSEYQENLPVVPCEYTKIQQVLLNILRNGAQAMQEGDPERSRFVIRTWFDKDADMVCMAIEDNGPGMDEVTSKRVFEPFFTTKPVGIGTGLGLSVSYFIITENHKGEIAVESKLGVGTTFTIRLPVKGVNQQ